MKLATKSILVVTVGALALASGAFAQEVEAEKSAPLQNFLPNSYGKMELRHELDVTMQETTVQNQTPNASARPTLGSTFFDGKLDTAFTWIFEKTADTVKINKTYFYNITTYDLLSGDNGSIKPYAEIYQTTPTGTAGESGFKVAYLGTEFATNAEVATGAGAITFSAYTLPLAVFSSGGMVPMDKPQNITGRAALTEEEIERQDPAYDSYTGVGVKFAPAAVTGLTAALGTELYRGWAPSYEVGLVDGSERTSLDNYDVTNMITNKFTVVYPLSDKVNLSNQVRHYIGGIYESGIDGKRWENRLAITATLF